MKKSIYKGLLALFTVFVVAFITISLTYSWFIKTNDSTFVIDTGEFASTMAVSFNDQVIDQSSPYYDDAKKVIIVDAGNPSNTNNITKLSVDLTITPMVTARFRIKILDEWRLKRTYYALGSIIEEAISHENGAIIPGDVDYPFTIANIENYTFDAASGYFYYNLLLEKGTTYQITFITSGANRPVFSNSVFYEECIVYLDFIVDIVQANRFSEVWGIGSDYFD
ncbi:MAG: hypothetical protein PHP65_01650 [Bacilli bacterium]|nr:hypothetical protein [Bacilli bacterium]